MPIVEVIDFENHKFIVLWCPGGDNRPYSSPKTMAKDNKERIHYIRKASSTIEPSDEEEKDLFNLANRIPFDDRVNHQADISDLNIVLIQNYLKEVNIYNVIDYCSQTQAVYDHLWNCSYPINELLHSFLDLFTGVKKYVVYY